MALVKCNHCNKETINNNGKCRWCNKELDKNLDNIERAINNTVKKQPLAEKESFLWICDKCNEENEPIYDACWNCSNTNEVNPGLIKEYEQYSRLEKEKESLIKRKASPGWVMCGFIFSILGGWIGFYFGFKYALGNYDSETKKTGWIMIIIGVVVNIIGSIYLSSKY